MNGCDARTCEKFRGSFPAARSKDNSRAGGSSGSTTRRRAMHSTWRLGVALAAVAATAEAGLIYLGRTYGSCEEERHKRLPGDDIIPAAEVQTDHAITIDAPPSAVWPWLVQMGWGRGAWYTARWVDRWLFPANGPSADRIVPELQDISIGTFIPDGKPETETGLHVVELQPERALVLRSNSHLPMSWRDRATLDWTWTLSSPLSTVASAPGTTSAHAGSPRLGGSRSAAGWASCPPTS